MCCFLQIHLAQLAFITVFFAQTTTSSMSTVLCNSVPQSAYQILKIASDALSEITDTQDKDQPLPFTTVVYGQTLDGSISPLTKTRLNISSSCSIRLLHSLRANHNAILVGINTIICDQPQLNVRNPLPGTQSISPRPVVIDSKLRLSTLSSIRLKNPIICTTLNNSDERWQLAQNIINQHCSGGELLTCAADATGRCDLPDCFRKLRERFSITSLLVEGGASVLQSVFEQQLVNQVVVTMRPCFLGGFRSMTRQLPEVLQLQNVVAASIGGDIVVYGRVDGHSSSSDTDSSSSSRERSQSQTCPEPSCESSASPTIAVENELSVDKGGERSESSNDFSYIEGERQDVLFL